MDHTWRLEKCGNSDEGGVDLALGKHFSESNNFGKICKAGTFCHT